MTTTSAVKDGLEFTHPDEALHPNLTDMGNAERLVMRYRGNILYSHDKKRWLCFVGDHWQWDDIGGIQAIAKLTVRKIYGEAELADDAESREALAKHAIKSEAEARIQAMVSLTESEPGIPVRLDELDANPWLFNVANGTLDLKTGELRPHSADDLLTTLVPIDYDPEAKYPPRWLKFLDEITGRDKELQLYLQKAVGYSLTGITTAQIFFFLYGLGLNGKSTFTTTIRKLTGDYGERVNCDAFILKDKNASGPKEALANLRSKRFVVGSELEDGRKLAVGLIKDMTGGETIKADRKYEHEMEFASTHKLWIVGNHKPVVTDTTLSIWRRLKLIPFCVTIPDEEIDPDLSQKLEEELPGILAWAVQGCLLWQREGLREPACVRDATAQYRHEQDILSDFLDECCHIQKTVTIPAGELYKTYKDWCEKDGSFPIGKTTFANSLREKGFLTRPGHANKSTWLGIRLKTDDEKVNLVNFQGQFLENTPMMKNSKEVYRNDPQLLTKLTNQSEGLPPPYPTHPCPKCGRDDNYQLTPNGEYICCGVIYDATT